MLVLSRIKRANGTKVMLGHNVYHFRPQPELTGDSEHVCEIESDAHACRLLLIAEGFREYGAPAVTGWDTVIEDECPSPEELAVLPVRKIFSAIKTKPLSSEDLTVLFEIEATGSNRSSVLKAITSERERRRNG